MRNIKSVWLAVVFSAAFLFAAITYYYPPLFAQRFFVHRALPLSADAPRVRGARDAFAFVSRAIDGDTIELTSGERVRYLGMNTPETVKPDFPVECFGPEAHERNAALVEGKQVRLVRDVSDVDKYGRLLRFVYVDKKFINLDLVGEGFARVETIAPNTGHLKEFVGAEESARANRRGLWGTCP